MGATASNRSAPAALPAGMRLGPLRIGAPIASDRTAILYHAQDETSDCPLIVAEYFPRAAARRHDDGAVEPGAARDEEMFEEGLLRFVDDARRLAELGTVPGLVPVRAAFEVNGTAYMVMEVAAGRPLGAALAAGQRLGAAEVVSMIRQVGGGLACAHAAGVVHNAITPERILIDSSGNATLVGFNSAPFGPDRVHPEPSPYLPVEAYAPVHGRGPWSDIYALAAVAQHALTGTPPLDALRRGTAPLPCYAHTPLEAVIATGMAVAPQQRPRSIEAWLSPLQPEARPKTPPRVSPAAEAIRPPAADSRPLAHAPTPTAARTSSDEIDPPGAWPPADATPRPATPRHTRRLAQIAAGAAIIGGLALGLSIRGAVTDESSRPGAIATTAPTVARADDEIALSVAAVQRILARVADAEAAGVNADDRQRLRMLAGRAQAYLARQREVRARLATNVSDSRRQELLVTLSDLSTAIRQSESSVAALAARSAAPEPVFADDAPAVGNPPADILPPESTPEAESTPATESAPTTAPPPPSDIAARRPYRPPFRPPPNAAASPAVSAAASPQPTIPPAAAETPAPHADLALEIRRARRVAADIDAIYGSVPAPTDDAQRDAHDQIADIRDRAHERLRQLEELAASDGDLAAAVDIARAARKDLETDLADARRLLVRARG